MADINQTAAWVTARLMEVGNATNGGLYTLLTSQNIGNYVAKNVSGVVAIANGGTGANNASDALQNLGALKTSDIATVGLTGQYDDLLNKPTIPTITDTYDAYSHNGMSGYAVATAVNAEKERAQDAEDAIQDDLDSFRYSALFSDADGMFYIVTPDE